MGISHRKGMNMAYIVDLVRFWYFMPDIPNE